MLQNRHTRRVAWPIVREHWDDYVGRGELPPLVKQAFPTGVSMLAQKDLADEARAFLEAKRTPDIQEIVAQSLERLRNNTEAAERLADELGDALAEKVSRR